MNLVDVQKLVSPYGPQVPAAELLEALNVAYHAREVGTYDSQHAEIRQQLPPLWREMIEVATSRSDKRSWRILDFGCGTGFEASQILHRLGRQSIAELWCYDLSPEMLNRCRERIAPSLPGARFTSCLDDVLTSGTQFDLLITNSLLHHLPTPVATLESLQPLLSDDAIWLAGHEPSRRFYQNVDCCGTYQRFLRLHRRKRRLSPSAYFQFAKRKLGVASTPAQAAAAAAHDNGLVKHRPPEQLVLRLVDLHVAHSTEEARSGRGFDVDQMQRQMVNLWQLVWTKSYSFMGPFYEGKLPPRWRNESTRLKQAFPADGANFCAVWQRSSTPTDRSAEAEGNSLVSHGDRYAGPDGSVLGVRK